MTAVINRTGRLLQWNLGVNEAASAINIARAVSSLFTQPEDSLVIEEIARGLHVRLPELPQWLQTLSFRRRGSFHGERMRKVMVDNLLEDVPIDTVQGRATFIALISRYVETAEQAAQNILSLFEERFAPLGHEVVRHRDTNRVGPLPYSIKDHVVKMVRSTWDSDRDSDQNTLCLFLMRQLFSCLGKNRVSQPTSTERSQADHRRLIDRLFGIGNLSERFDTLDIGSAMMAIAAHAQGVPIQVECMLEENMPGTKRTRTSRRTLCNNESLDAFTVCLWLTQPPSDIAYQLNIFYEGLHIRNSRSPQKRFIPVLGGAAEISQMLALQFKAELPPEDSLVLWQAGMAFGESARWTLGTGKDLEGPHPLFIRLSEDFLMSIGPVDEAVAEHARNHFSGRRMDERAQLARKAAMIVHGIYKYREYSDKEQFHAKMNVALVAITVGCVKSQIRNPQGGNELESFAWTFDFQEKAVTSCLGQFHGANPLTLCESLPKAVNVDSLLQAAACIWGGSTLEYHGHRRLSLNAIGIVCPHVTLVFDVVGNLERIAQYGITKPFISMYTGSMPLLPQEPQTGFVVGGTSFHERDRRRIMEGEHFDVDAEPNSHPPIFTIESVNTGSYDGNFCATICAWRHGEVFAELEPVTLLHNLSQPHNQLGELTKLNPPEYSARSFMELRCTTLHTLRHFQIDKAAGLVRTSLRWQWHVVAAGLVERGFVAIIDDEVDLDALNKVKDDKRAEGLVFLFVGSEDNVLSSSHSSVSRS